MLSTNINQSEYLNKPKNINEDDLREPTINEIDSSESLNRQTDNTPLINSNEFDNSDMINE